MSSVTPAMAMPNPITNTTSMSSERTRMYHGVRTS